MNCTPGRSTTACTTLAALLLLAGCGQGSLPQATFQPADPSGSATNPATSPASVPAPYGPGASPPGSVGTPATPGSAAPAPIRTPVGAVPAPASPVPAPTWGSVPAGNGSTVPVAPPAPVATPAPGGSVGSGPYAAQVQAVLSGTNALRAQVGAAPLTLDSRLQPIAMGRAQDMATRNYFSHVNPDGKTVFDLMQAAGILYVTAGENIAEGQPDGASVVKAWYDDVGVPDLGHRKNMLNAAFGHIGIGVAQGSSGLIWVQDFMN